MSWFWPEGRMSGALRRGILVGTGAWLFLQASNLLSGMEFGLLAGAVVWLVCVGLCFVFDGLWYRARQRQLARFRTTRELWELADDELQRRWDARPAVSLGRSLAVSLPITSGLVLIGDGLGFGTAGWPVFALACVVVTLVWFGLEWWYWRSS